jgi:hypothetical protein
MPPLFYNKLPPPLRYGGGLLLLIVREGPFSLFAELETASELDLIVISTAIFELL